jgi:hypothetical protein
MSLAEMPGVERMLLAVVEAVPEWHPVYATFEPFPVFGWVVRHPDGPIVVDTGVGIGNAAIDGWYQPRVTPLVDALTGVEVDPRDVAAGGWCSRASVCAGPLSCEREHRRRPTCTAPTGRRPGGTRSGACWRWGRRKPRSATMPR